MEKARSMMLICKIQNRLWIEVVKTKAYIQNECLTRLNPKVNELLMNETRSLGFMNVEPLNHS